ncbi:hypothetical protein COOONC_05912 [Cooperia oncophora]
MYETTKLRIWDLQGNPHELSLCKTKCGTVSPKVLIGCDHLWPLLNSPSPQHILPSGLHAIPSLLGYLLSGPQYSKKDKLLQKDCTADTRISTLEADEVEQIPDAPKITKRVVAQQISPFTIR